MMVQQPQTEPIIAYIVDHDTDDSGLSVLMCPACVMQMRESAPISVTPVSEIPSPWSWDADVYCDLCGSELTPVDRTYQSLWPDGPPPLQPLEAGR